jgi:hypothetical protein
MTTVWLRRHWNDSIGGEYRLEDLQGLHWDLTSGGARVRSPYPMVYGYVMCDQALDDGVSHSCAHRVGPHSIKVCVVAKDNPPALMRQLKALATENARRRSPLRLTAGAGATR